MTGRNLTLPTKARRGAPVLERLERYIERDAASGCWLWRGCTDGTPSREGYALLTIDYKIYKAHRVSYEAHVGPIPEGLQLDHLCRVRRCVNPKHLEPVTAAENLRRAAIHATRVTECPYGHQYDESNTYVVPTTGDRQCRSCRRVRDVLWRAMTPQERATRKAAGLPVVDLAAHFAQQQENAA